MKLQWNFKIPNGIILNETIQCHTAGIAIRQLASYMWLTHVIDVAHASCL
jgi:hypothetical protein